MLTDHAQDDYGARVPTGQFGVVRLEVARCPWTGDAPRNVSRSLVSLHMNRGNADLAATVLDMENEDFSADVHHEVWPRATRVNEDE